jgi:hypothetical protein
LSYQRSGYCWRVLIAVTVIYQRQLILMHGIKVIFTEDGSQTIIQHPVGLVTTADLEPHGIELVYRQ